MKKILLFLSVFLLFHTSCDDGFEELNQNPFSPTTVQNGPLFNGIVESLRLGWDRQLFLHNEKLYDVTELAVVTAETFQNIEGASEDIWTNYYGALKNARELERRFEGHSGDPEAVNIVWAQLKIIMAYKTFQMLDLFGDIPYSEAGRAFDENPILRPTYDDDEVIYKSLLDDLAWSVDILVNSEATTGTGEAFLSYGTFDTFLGNDRGRWTQFASSLQLRYLLRMYDKEPAYVDPIVKEMLESGISFIEPDGDVVMNPRTQDWLNEGVNWSFREHNKVRLGSTIWDFMTVNDDIIDPRMHLFFEPNNAGDWVAFPQISNENTPQSGGNPYASSRDQSYEDKGAGNIYGSVNYYLIRDEQDIPELLISAAEVKFLLAEVYQRGIGVAADASNAGFNYQLGMLASMNYWQDLMLGSAIWENRPPTQTQGDFYNVTIHPKYDIMTASDDEARLKLIYEQRWVDAFRQPWEAWSLLRRTNMTPRTKATNTFHRLQYPPSEKVNNPENWAAQVARMGGDEQGVKIWWEK